MPIRFLSLLLCAALLQPAPTTLHQLRTGTLLRMHVVAQDDTPAMQAVKAPVRDAVQAAYHASSVRTGSMLADALLLLPTLADAARQAARDAAFSGPVTATVELADFDTRSLHGLTVPAGRYPALMIRLGEARGHNWWGLLDPDTALDAAAATHSDGPIVWDWSLAAFLDALFGWMGGDADAA